MDFFEFAKQVAMLEQLLLSQLRDVTDAVVYIKLPTGKHVKSLELVTDDNDNLDVVVK